MIIRQFNQETDLAGLKACVISVQDYESNLDPRMPQGSDIVDEYIPEMFEACEHSDGKILVADVDGDVAGYVLILNRVKSESIDDGDLEYGLVRDLVVLEDYRGKGIGGALLRAAEAEARDSGVKWLRIEVLDANETARDLYLSKGFSPLLSTLEKRLHKAQEPGHKKYCL